MERLPLRTCPHQQQQVVHHSCRPLLVSQPRFHALGDDDGRIDPVLDPADHFPLRLSLVYGVRFGHGGCQVGAVHWRFPRFPFSSWLAALGSASHLRFAVSLIHPLSLSLVPLSLCLRLPLFPGPWFPAPQVAEGKGGRGEDVIHFFLDSEEESQESSPCGICAIERSSTTDEEDGGWESQCASVLVQSSSCFG